MLAALLCNLGGTPTPPPPAKPQQFFGGGPFTRKYGYDRYYREAKEAREELPGPKAEVVEQAIFRAVEAIREEKSEEIVIDAKRIYDRVFRELRSELREKLWRAEISRRIQEQEEEELMVFLISL